MSDKNKEEFVRRFEFFIARRSRDANLKLPSILQELTERLAVVKETVALWRNKNKPTVPSRQNYPLLGKVLHLTSQELNELLFLAGHNALSNEEIILHDKIIWQQYISYFQFFSGIMGESALSRVIQHFSSPSGKIQPWLLCTQKNQFQYFHLAVLKGFFAKRFEKYRLLEIIPSKITDENAYFIDLSKQIFGDTNPIKNSTEFQYVLENYVYQYPSLLLIHHFGDSKNAEVLAQILRAIYDKQGNRNSLLILWIAGKELAYLHAKQATDSLLSIARVQHYKTTDIDVALAAHEYFSGMANLASIPIKKIFADTGGEYHSVAFFLEYFKQHQELPCIQELKNYLAEMPLFHSYYQISQQLHVFLQKEEIYIMPVQLGFNALLNNLYWDHLLRFSEQDKLVWINPSIREIGLEVTAITSVF